MTTHHRRSAARTLVAASLLTLCACASTEPVPYARAFPSNLPVSERDFDIQVIQGDTSVRMTNTTAHDFGPFDLWLNMWFVRPVDGLRVGESVTLPVGEFRDEFSRPFRGGGFFAIQAPDLLVAAHIEIDGRLHRLIAVPRRTN